MRADLRLPWPVLVEGVLDRWRHGFLGAWLEREWCFFLHCPCARWTHEHPALDGMPHWQLHPLVHELEELRAHLERSIAIELIPAGQRESARRVPISVGPALSPSRKRRLDAEMVRFDALVAERLAEVPTLARRLVRECVGHQLAVATPGMFPVSEVLGGVLDRLDTAPRPEETEPGTDAAPCPPEGEVPDERRRALARTVRSLYVRLGLEAPFVLWARSPAHAEELAAGLADLCVVLLATPCGFPELETELVWARHEGHLDEASRAAVTAAAAHVLELAEPELGLLPVVGHLEHLEARALLALGALVGQQGGALAEDLRRGRRRPAAPVGPREVERGRFAWAVERAVEAERAPERPRASATDRWSGVGVLEELALRSSGEVPGVTEVLTLRRELHSWSGTRAVAILVPEPELHRDAAGLLHHEHGPAARWPDGWGVYFWHGTPVPADLVTRGWVVERILGELNLEVRRCAIERLGWDRFAEEARLRQVGRSAPDPANPGYELSLFDIPEELLNRAELRLLVCTNASVERDGTRRRFGLTVPARFADPVAAAAWTFDLTREQYVRLEAAT